MSNTPPESLHGNGPTFSSGWDICGEIADVYEAMVTSGRIGIGDVRFAVRTSLTCAKKV